MEVKVCFLLHKLKFMMKNPVKRTLSAILAILMPHCAQANSPDAELMKNYTAQGEKIVYLTFDDGPSASTDEILSVLSEKNVKATFFLVGERVEKYPDKVMSIFEGGHSVGIHSHTHRYSQIYSSQTALKDDVFACFCAIKAVNCNFTPRIYRFPGGSFGRKKGLLKVPEQLGLRYYDWNASVRDCELPNPSPEQLLRCAIDTSKGKSTVILLMHDAKSKAATVQALPGIIDYYAQKGFSFGIL